MKLFQNILDNLRHFRDLSSNKLGRWGRLGQGMVRMAEICFKRLRKDNAMAMSAALSFRTIFAMMPILVLSFLMLKSTGIVRDQKQLFNDLMHEAGFDSIIISSGENLPPGSRGDRRFGRPRRQPGTNRHTETSPQTDSATTTNSIDPPPPATNDGEPNSGTEDPPTAPGDAPSDTTKDTAQDDTITLGDKIRELWMQVERRLTFGRIGPVGVLVLVWTALTLLTTMENCLNRVFHAPKNRSFFARLPIYWTTITLGPMLLVVASYFGAKLSTLPTEIPLLAGMVNVSSWIARILVGVLVISAIYRYMPNTHVGMRAASLGGVVAFPLWVFTRWAFDLYVKNVAVQSIYGALGLLPLFLLWLNTSWWIFLFGAELANANMNLDQFDEPEVQELASEP